MEKQRRKKPNDQENRLLYVTVRWTAAARFLPLLPQGQHNSTSWLMCLAFSFIDIYSFPFHKISIFVISTLRSETSGRRWWNILESCVFLWNSGPSLAFLLVFLLNFCLFILFTCFRFLRFPCEKCNQSDTFFPFPELVPLLFDCPNSLSGHYWVSNSSVSSSCFCTTFRRFSIFPQNIEGDLTRISHSSVSRKHSYDRHLFLVSEACTID